MFQFSQDTDDHFKLREIVSKAFFSCQSLIVKLIAFLPEVLSVLLNIN